MENDQATQDEHVKQIYQYAANLLVEQKMNSVEATEHLVSKGLDAESANTVVSSIETHIVKAKKDKAQKDILFGALWCVGGIAATAANIGYIFWGAIVFGGIQFFRGLANAS